MIKALTFLLFSLTVFEIFAEVRLWVPPVIRTGTLTRILVWDESPVPPVTLKITNPRHEVLFESPGFALGFPVQAGTGPLSVSAVLAAVDPLTPEEELTVTLELAGGKTLERKVQVWARSYREEVIPLNPQMSDLRSKPDPRKDKEAEIIWKIYRTFDPQDLWAQGIFGAPLDPAFPQSAYFADKRRYVYSNGQSSVDYHRGADFACPRGTPVLASARGRVVLAAERELTGNSVVIAHYPGVYSVSFHLQKIAVKVGQTVEKGDGIGLSGMTGLATGPHLHWEFRCRGVPFDGKDLWTADPLDKEEIAAIISAIERKRG